ncbi:MAG TPA: hypothetical protein ENN29_08735 [Candidatus Hydrogenedentes bacterium]|nr:hypothetical protein [Candidatus Hydrogenedentota bacterium]
MKTLKVSKGGDEITSVDAWHKYAPPKEENKHWKDGRSAKELAKAWFPDDSGQPTVPAELTQLLESCLLTQGLTFREAWPEYITRLDSFKGEHRNADLVILADSAKGKFLLSIEAKADETFGKPIVDRLNDVKNNPKSKILERISLLTKAIFGKTIEEDPAIGSLYYQLLTGVAGTLIEARNQKADYAIFIVHEFVSKECCTDDNLSCNKNAMIDFIDHLKTEGKSSTAFDGKLAGRFKVFGNESVPSNIHFYIGKIRRCLDKK